MEAIDWHWKGWQMVLTLRHLNIFFLGLGLDEHSSGKTGPSVIAVGQLGDVFKNADETLEIRAPVEEVVPAER